MKFFPLIFTNYMPPSLFAKGVINITSQELMTEIVSVGASCEYSPDSRCDRRSRVKGKNRGAAVQAVHYLHYCAITATVQGLPCRYRAIPCLTFITILNTRYSVSSV